jgi:hypothetical protein
MGQQEEHYRWQTPLAWFGPAWGCALWLGISGGVLISRGSATEGAVLFGLFLLVMTLTILLWLRRSRVSAYVAWQAVLATLWISGLVAAGVLHATATYPQVHLDEWGMLLLWVGIGIGIPLLMLDTYARHKSDGTKGIWSALFDLLAGFS